MSFLAGADQKEDFIQKFHPCLNKRLHKIVLEYLTNSAEVKRSLELQQLFSHVSGTISSEETTDALPSCPNYSVVELEKKFDVIISLLLDIEKQFILAEELRKDSLLILILALFGEHISSAAWSSDVTRRAAEVTLESVQRIFNCSLPSLLVCQQINGVSVLEALTHFLYHKLKGLAADFNVRAVKAFMFYVQQVQSMKLEDLVYIIIPVVGKLTFGADLERRIEAFMCLSTIVDSNTISFAFIQSLLDYLEPHLYCSEPTIILPAIKTFLKLVEKAELNILKENRWTSYDKLLEVLISRMLNEQSLVLREAYIQALLLVIQSGKLRSSKQAKSLVEVFFDYAHHSTSRLTTLNVVKLYIEFCWPVLQPTFKRLSDVLIKTLINISSEDVMEKKIENYHEALHLIEQIFILLHNLFPEKMQIMMEELLEVHKENKSLCSKLAAISVVSE